MFKWRTLSISRQNCDLEHELETHDLFASWFVYSLSLSVGSDCFCSPPPQHLFDENKKEKKTYLWVGCGRGKGIPSRRD